MTNITIDYKDYLAMQNKIKNFEELKKKKTLLLIKSCESTGSFSFKSEKTELFGNQNTSLEEIKKQIKESIDKNKKILLEIKKVLPIAKKTLIKKDNLWGAVELDNFKFKDWFFK